MAKFSDKRKIITPSTYTIHVSWIDLDEAINRYKQKFKLELEPDFQRDHIWTEKQQQLYLEFILKGGNSGRNIYFNCSGWSNNFKGPMQLVDGLQRITAIRRFLNNELPIFNSDYYGDFTDHIPSYSDLIFHIHNLETRQEVLEWYIDLNSGVAHTEKEINRVKKLLDEERLKK